MNITSSDYLMIIAGAYKMLTSVSPCSRNINSFDPTTPYKVGTILLPILQMRKQPERLSDLLRGAQREEAELASTTASH